MKIIGREHFGKEVRMKAFSRVLREKRRKILKYAN